MSKVETDAGPSWRSLSVPTAAEVAARFDAPPSEYGLVLWWGWEGPITGDVIRGDEPDYAHVPRTPDLPAEFERRKGYDVRPYLASFFAPQPSDEARRARADYWDVWVGSWWRPACCGCLRPLWTCEREYTRQIGGDE